MRNFFTFQYDPNQDQVDLFKADLREPSNEDTESKNSVEDRPTSGLFEQTRFSRVNRYASFHQPIAKIKPIIHLASSNDALDDTVSEDLTLRLPQEPGYHWALIIDVSLLYRLSIFPSQTDAKLKTSVAPLITELETAIATLDRSNNLDQALQSDQINEITSTVRKVNRQLSRIKEKITCNREITLIAQLQNFLLKTSFTEVKVVATTDSNQRQLHLRDIDAKIKEFNQKLEQFITSPKVEQITEKANAVDNILERSLIITPLNSLNFAIENFKENVNSLLNLSTIDSSLNQFLSKLKEHAKENAHNAKFIEPQVLKQHELSQFKMELPQFADNYCQVERNFYFFAKPRFNFAKGVKRITDLTNAQLEAKLKNEQNTPFIEKCHSIIQHPNYIEIMLDYLINNREKHYNSIIIDLADFANIPTQRKRSTKTTAKDTSHTQKSWFEVLRLISTKQTSTSNILNCSKLILIADLKNPISISTNEFFEVLEQLLENNSALTHITLPDNFFFSEKDSFNKKFSAFQERVLQKRASTFVIETKQSDLYDASIRLRLAKMQAETDRDYQLWNEKSAEQASQAATDEKNEVKQQDQKQDKDESKIEDSYFNFPLIELLTDAAATINVETDYEQEIETQVQQPAVEELVNNYQRHAEQEQHVVQQSIITDASIAVYKVFADRDYCPETSLRKKIGSSHSDDITKIEKKLCNLCVAHGVLWNQIKNTYFTPGIDNASVAAIEQIIRHLSLYEDGIDISELPPGFVILQRDSQHVLHYDEIYIERAYQNEDGRALQTHTSATKLALYDTANGVLKEDKENPASEWLKLPLTKTYGLRAHAPEVCNTPPRAFMQVFLDKHGLFVQTAFLSSDANFNEKRTAFITLLNDLSLANKEVSKLGDQYQELIDQLPVLLIHHCQYLLITQKFTGLKMFLAQLEKLRQSGDLENFIKYCLVYKHPKTFEKFCYAGGVDSQRYQGNTHNIATRKKQWHEYRQDSKTLLNLGFEKKHRREVLKKIKSVDHPFLGISPCKNMSVGVRDDLEQLNHLNFWQQIETFTNWPKAYRNWFWLLCDTNHTSKNNSPWKNVTLLDFNDSFSAYQKFIQAIEKLWQERGLDKQILIDILTETYQKHLSMANGHAFQCFYNSRDLRTILSRILRLTQRSLYPAELLMELLNSDQLELHRNSIIMRASIDYHYGFVCDEMWQPESSHYQHLNYRADHTTSSNQLVKYKKEKTLDLLLNLPLRCCILDISKRSDHAGFSKFSNPLPYVKSNAFRYIAQQSFYPSLVVLRELSQVIENHFVTDPEPRSIDDEAKNEMAQNLFALLAMTTTVEHSGFVTPTITFNKIKELLENNQHDDALENLKVLVTLLIKNDPKDTDKKIGKLHQPAPPAQNQCLSFNLEQAFCYLRACAQNYHSTNPFQMIAVGFNSNNLGLRNLHLDNFDASNAAARLSLQLLAIVKTSEVTQANYNILQRLLEQFTPKQLRLLTKLLYQVDLSHNINPVEFATLKGQLNKLNKNNQTDFVKQAKLIYRNFGIKFHAWDSTAGLSNKTEAFQLYELASKRLNSEQAKHLVTGILDYLESCTLNIHQDSFNLKTFKALLSSINRLPKHQSKWALFALMQQLLLVEHKPSDYLSAITSQLHLLKRLVESKKISLQNKKSMFDLFAYQQKSVTATNAISDDLFSAFEEFANTWPTAITILFRITLESDNRLSARKLLVTLIQELSSEYCQLRSNNNEILLLQLSSLTNLENTLEIIKIVNTRTKNSGFDSESKSLIAHRLLVIATNLLRNAPKDFNLSEIQKILQNISFQELQQLTKEQCREFYILCYQDVEILKKELDSEGSSNKQLFKYIEHKGKFSKTKQDRSSIPCDQIRNLLQNNILHHSTREDINEAYAEIIKFSNHYKKYNLSKLIDIWEEFKNTDNQNQISNRKLIALLGELLRRNNGIVLHPTQIAAIYYALQHGNNRLLMNIETGEGKTFITLLSTIIKSQIYKHTVYVSTSNLMLAERDWQQAQPLCQLLGIQTNFITAQSPANAHCDTGINFTTLKALAGFYQQHNKTNPPKNALLWLDECDQAILNHDPIKLSASHRGMPKQLYQRFLHFSLQITAAYLQFLQNSKARQNQEEKQQNNLDKLQALLKTPKVQRRLAKFSLPAYIDQHAINRLNFADGSTENVINALCQAISESITKDLHLLSPTKAYLLEKLNSFSKFELLQWLQDAFKVLTEIQQGVHFVLTREGALPGHQRIAVINPRLTNEHSKFSGQIHPLLATHLNLLAKDDYKQQPVIVKQANQTQKLIDNRQFIEKFNGDNRGVIGVSGTVPSRARSQAIAEELMRYQLQLQAIAIPRRGENKTVVNIPSIVPDEQLDDELLNKINSGQGEPVVIHCRDENEVIAVTSYLTNNLTDGNYTKSNIKFITANTPTSQERFLRQWIKQDGHILVTNLWKRGEDPTPTGVKGEEHGLHVIGLHVEDIADEDQRRGRTGRQSNPGTYDAIFSDSDLPFHAKLCEGYAGITKFDQVEIIKKLHAMPSPQFAYCIAYNAEATTDCKWFWCTLSSDTKRIVSTPMVDIIQLKNSLYTQYLAGKRLKKISKSAKKAITNHAQRHASVLFHQQRQAEKKRPVREHQQIKTLAITSVVSYYELQYEVVREIVATLEAQLRSLDVNVKGSKADLISKDEQKLQHVESKSADDEYESKNTEPSEQHTIHAKSVKSEKLICHRIYWQRQLNEIQVKQAQVINNLSFMLDCVTEKKVQCIAKDQQLSSAEASALYNQEIMLEAKKYRDEATRQLEIYQESLSQCQQELIEPSPEVKTIAPLEIETHQAVRHELPLLSVEENTFTQHHFVKAQLKRTKKRRSRQRETLAEIFHNYQQRFSFEVVEQQYFVGLRATAEKDAQQLQYWVKEDIAAIAKVYRSLHFISRDRKKALKRLNNTFSGNENLSMQEMYSSINDTMFETIESDSAKRRNTESRLRHLLMTQKLQLLYLTKKDKMLHIIKHEIDYLKKLIEIDKKRLIGLSANSNNLQQKYDDLSGQLASFNSNNIENMLVIYQKMQAVINHPDYTQKKMFLHHSFSFWQTLLPYITHCYKGIKPHMKIDEYMGWQQFCDQFNKAHQDSKELISPDNNTIFEFLQHRITASLKNKATVGTPKFTTVDDKPHQFKLEAALQDANPSGFKEQKMELVLHFDETNNKHPLRVHSFNLRPRSSISWSRKDLLNIHMMPQPTKRQKPASSIGQGSALALQDADLKV